MDFADLQDRLLFAIPKKGRLHEKCLQLLQGADIQFHRRNRLDIALSTNLPLALVFLPAADIAKFVGEGNVDIGITGQDVVVESGANVEEILQLGFGKCDLCVQTPIKNGEYKGARDLVGKRIVTSFESIVARYFNALEAGMSQQDASASLLNTSSTNAGAVPPSPRTVINYVSGSVEAACALGLADAIVDLVESGETMRAAKLHAITTVLTSQAVLICNPRKHNTVPLIETLKRRIEGVIVAQRYVLCNYNISRDRLKQAIAVTPGKKAATVSPLEDNNWVAVSAMVSKKEVAEIMDKLEVIGATDILVVDIHNSRVRT
ncbi:ATP phosphoribosyltransferase (ATP-PRTase) (ATP-PRT) [Borealophlyctis nickersoniae]|nr:ATP phosphoribosyltransferase (ATP-PRTase) (ATP-PRT) [Borealophlyctis nickersoniae]